MSLVVAIKVPTGVVVAGDSRTTFPNAHPIVFDAERKVFRVPGTPILVGIAGEVRRGPSHAVLGLRDVFSSGAQSVEDVAHLVARVFGRLGLFRAHVVVAGCTPDPVVWSVFARDDGRWSTEEQLAGAFGAYWVGTTAALDRLVNGVPAATSRRVVEWAERAAGRTLNQEERSSLESLSRPPQPSWEALPLDEASCLLGSLLAGVAAWHRLVDGNAAPVGGAIEVQSVDVFGDVRAFPHTSALRP